MNQTEMQRFLTVCHRAAVIHQPKLDLAALIESFPCLAMIGLTWHEDDRRASIDTLHSVLATASSGQVQAIQFALHVFNWREYPFDLGRALNKWDDDNLAAFQRWALDPWYM